MPQGCNWVLSTQPFLGRIGDHPNLRCAKLRATENSVSCSQCLGGDAQLGASRRCRADLARQRQRSVWFAVNRINDAASVGTEPGALLSAAQDVDIGSIDDLSGENVQVNVAA